MVLIYSFVIGCIAGIINYSIARKKGHTSISVLVLGILAFTAVAFSLLKYIL
jgi:uncharacterized membrane protein YeaQ/YmgE (transglycosylase-associated protein family)